MIKNFKLKIKNCRGSGFSLIEVIVAVGLFAIIAGGGVTGIIGPLIANRSSGELFKATQLAQEGVEAVRSIRDQNFANIISGTKGIGVSSSLWSFVGTSDVTDKYTRVVNIKNASRDTGGSLVTSGGTTDPDSFIVKSDVNWNFSVGDTRNVSVSTLLTNWRKSIGSAFDGLIVYGDGTTFPKWRNYISATNVFETESIMPAIVGNPRNFVIRTSPTKNEAIAGMLSTDGNLYTYCFDGANWTLDWSVTIGVGTTRTKPFDIAYENTSGKAIVLYSTNVATTNELNFRTKSGTNNCGSVNWSSATAFDPIRTTAAVSWVKMASNPTAGSNLIAAIWADWNKDLSGAIWNGTNFANEPTAVTDSALEAINTGATSPDVEAWDLAYESVAGDLMVIWGTDVGANSNGVRYRLCTGNIATCTWGVVTLPPTFTDDATNLDLSANPDTDEMVFASIGNAQSDLQIGYWSGVGWTNTANVDNGAQVPLAGTKLVATGWLNSGATKSSIIVYNKSGANNIRWYNGNLGTFFAGTNFAVSPNFANPQKWYEISVNPKSKDQLMFTVSDNNNDLFAKRLVMGVGGSFTWSNSDGGAALETTLGQAIAKPFGFAWRNF